MRTSIQPGFMKPIKEMVFPVPFYSGNNGELFEIGGSTAVSFFSDSLLPPVRLFCELVELYHAIAIIPGENPTENDCFIVKYSELLCPDEYEITVGTEKVVVCGGGTRGVTYALMSLLQMLVTIDGRLYVIGGTIRDRPLKEIRGIHVYMPPRAELENFKKLINMFCMLKYNTLFLEVGGGMEYKRHPEVNVQWEKFCKEAAGFPGGQQGVQRHSYYWKDSLHTELGGGSCLSREEVLDIVGYAKAVGLDVIPEVQALSHCYYLTLAHREISECPDQPFPDTFCPSNEKSYELYFDIADEVIEVFKPETVSIGHDEIRILGLCGKCSEKTGDELLAYEINRLYDYYKSKNIKVAMWGEKLQCFTGSDGIPHGGIESVNTDEYGNVWRIPATHKAVDSTPKDILMLDWYHGLGNDVEDWFAEKGFKEIFGNFHGALFSDWERRGKKPNVLGAEVSTWCLANESTFGRDGLMMDFAFSSLVLWSEAYDESRWGEMQGCVLGRMPWLREAASGRRLALGSAGCELRPVYKGAPLPYSTFVNVGSMLQNTQNDGLISLLKTFEYPSLFGVAIDYTNINVQVNGYADGVIFINSASKREEFLESYTMKKIESWHMAVYSVIYGDGTTENIITSYGIHYGDIHMDWGTADPGDGGWLAEIDEKRAKGRKSAGNISPYRIITDRWRDSLCYYTVPLIDTENGKTVYAWEWVNPHPDKIIRCIVPVNTSSDTSRKAYLFCVATVNHRCC